jgi:DNA-binding SARP family transcriptional activator
MRRLRTRLRIEASSNLHLRLLNRFELSIAGRSHGLPTHSQRVLAFLAVRGRTQQRATLAGRLWMDVPEYRSQASLRTALWRIRQADAHLIHADYASVSLQRNVSVDLDLLLAQAHRLLSGEGLLAGRDCEVETLCSDLLPSWDEDWVLLERERVRQVRLHALEALCRRLTLLGRYAYAIEAGQEAVTAEPLRESAHAALIEAHLAEGNLVEARRQYRYYATLMRDELGADPSEKLRALAERQVDELDGRRQGAAHELKASKRVP